MTDHLGHVAAEVAVVGEDLVLVRGDETEKKIRLQRWHKCVINLSPFKRMSNKSKFCNIADVLNVELLAILGLWKLSF